MTFFKNRLYSLIVVTIFTAIVWGHSGGDLLAEQYNVDNYDDLARAFELIAKLPSNSNAEINILRTIDLAKDLPELNVPQGVTVNINGGTINGNKKYQGLVVNADETAKVHVTNTVFKDCAGSTAIFLNGSDIGLGSTGTLKPDSTFSDNINDISATLGFDKWQEDPEDNKKYLLQSTAGGVTINAGNKVTLTGNNNYAGVTLIKDGATLVANGTTLKDSKGKDIKDAFGRTMGNVIGDLSEVRIGDGTLRLEQNETIGYLSSDASAIPNSGKVELNGKTLIIAGDEDRDQFGKGINPATGEEVKAFTGKITGNGELVKTGTGRLTLNGDSSGSDFTTTIYQGTVVLGDANALGQGDVTIRNIDTGSGLTLRNTIEANKHLIDDPINTITDAVMNNFIIEKKGKTLDGVTKDFGTMVVGGKYDIQFGRADDEGGQITGGDLLINMVNADNKIYLANIGQQGTTPGTYSAGSENNYGKTLLQRGTVVVYANGSGVGNTLGKGDVHALGAAGLSAGTGGMTISNNIFLDLGSILTLSNESSGDYTISGKISGDGGLTVDLIAPSDSVTLTGNIGHKGSNYIKNGTLVIDPATPRTATVLYDLSAGAGGTLKVMEGDLIADIRFDSTYSGEILMTGGGTVTKTGKAIWTFKDGLVTDSITVSAGALQLAEDGTVNHVTLNGNGRLIIADNPGPPVTTNNVTLEKLASSSGTNVTILNDNTLTLKDVGGDLFNTWSGGTDAKVTFEKGATLQSGSGSAWKGEMIVGDGTNAATLTVMAAGGLGDANNAQVTLNAGSTLVLNANSQIKQLNVSGVALSVQTVQVNGNNNFATKTLAGTADVTKTGTGIWTMLDSSAAFSNAVNLYAGGIHLNSPTSDWGSGDLNVNADGTSLYVDVDGSKQIDNTINLINPNENLNIIINDCFPPGTPGELTLTSITGDGGINYKGGGTLIYDVTTTGTIDYKGVTNVSGGILDLRGFTPLSGNSLGDVNVKNGGTLTGSGSNTVGDLTFDVGSYFIADFTSGDPLITANDITISNDGAVAHIVGSGGVGKVLMESTTNSGSGMFWFTDDVLGKRAVGEWDSTQTILSITFKDLNYLDDAFTTDARRVASYMTAIGDNTTTPTIMGSRGPSPYPVDNKTMNLLLALENVVPPAEFDYALLEVGGQINASLVTAQVQTTTGMFQSVTKQLYPVGFMTEPCDDGYAVSNGAIYRGQSMRRGWTGWSSGLGAFGETKDNKSRGTFGYDYNSYGMSVGIEPTSPMSAFRIGLFYAYSYTDIDTNKTIGGGNVSDHFIGAYGRFVDSLGYTSFVAGFGFDKYKTDRDVTKPTLGPGTPYGGHSRADFDGWQGGLYLERGLGPRTRLGLQPYVGLQYLNSSTDAYCETGDNKYKLETDSAEVNSLRSNLGVRFARQICRVKRGDLYLSGNVSWMHEFLDTDCEMASKWAVSNNPSTFVVSGNSTGRDWAVMGAGMDWKLRQRLSVFGSYDLYANSDQMLNVGNVGARIEW